MNRLSTIHILDENTANKIAAGEVVERPASVVKELVENSIDASSSKIEVEISDGGTKFIRVTDDGIGMSRADAELAILRHATSKIRLVDDLTQISTLGFRGEALPSIASVSKFTLTTRLHTDSLATFVEVEGGKLVELRDAGSNVGTTITVSNLFFNTPARQKFLKTNATESNYISNILMKLALSHPEISIKFINNNKLVFSTPGTNNLADAISGIYGHKIASELLPILLLEDSIEITGYISKPSILKSSRSWQTFLVNSRVIQSRFIAKAVDSAYHSLLPKVGYPLVVVNIVVPNDYIDINVHPQKSEVKFSNDQIIYRLVYKAVSNALKEATRDHKNLAVSLDIPIKPAKVNVSTSIPKSYPKPQETVSLWREDMMPLRMVQETIHQQNPVLLFQNSDGSPSDNSTSEEQAYFQPLGQLDDCFIVARGQDGLYIIDQHAAHERILYDKMCNSVGRIPVQQLLTPIFMESDAGELNIIEANAEVFHSLGFTLDQVGPNIMRLLEVPADIPTSEAENILREILVKLTDMHNPAPSELRHACLQTAACRAAIKAGDTLNMRQIKALLEDLFKTELPYNCPHGRPAIIKFSHRDLAKMFKRI
ncbi:MAG: DNA mismatch repair endonuclease MutL [Veillonellaceae bacterium]|jgi:DNA mismatch repair protein MutL|nr:DNA mismatch repair endonuclease MutL [Veillonellaceae bacterium]